MKNILVVFTGGTIGSSVCNGEINTDTQTHFLLLSQFKMRYPQMEIHFTTLQPYEILSENLTPSVWTLLIQTIENANPNVYDGIIITHGTDTLAYTSAALTFYFHALDVPIYLVSSHYPLSDMRSNGLDNFSFAVNSIIGRFARISSGAAYSTPRILHEYSNTERWNQRLYLLHGLESTLACEIVI
jgi:L-asparaginase